MSSRGWHSKPAPPEKVHHGRHLGPGYLGPGRHPEKNYPPAGIDDPALILPGHPQQAHPRQQALGPHDPGHGFQVAQAVLQGEGQAPLGHERREGLGGGFGLISLDRHDGQIARPHLRRQANGHLDEALPPLQGVHLDTAEAQPGHPLRPVIHQSDLRAGLPKEGGQETSQGPRSQHGQFH